ncbi:DUF418 domain-containing protein [Halosquirtibacter xylanolyticus]|uniref:DUF418 domain-containing protein n=1 Tax=Halosquirtibacter xylanolyticus TaxID=3374599 RepID=UPI00374874B5|nr:DUF418 domain-containing protein [Prolixibacteraceae bacterium]
MNSLNKNSNQPTTGKNRIIFLDVLRGFALVGIIYANSLSWSGIKFMPFTEIEALGNLETDKVLYQLLKFFVDTKFYTLFSLLFGVGFYMQYARSKSKNDFNRMYLRRLAVLFLIGIIHALIWSGDILTLYALMGMVLWSLRELSSKQVFRLSILLYFFPLILDIIYMYTFASDMPSLPNTALKVYPDMPPEMIVDGFRSTHFLKVFGTNFHNLVWRWFDFIPSGRPFKVIGLFLMGSYLFQKEFITQTSKQFRYMLPLFICGISFTAIAINLNGSVSSFSKEWSNIVYKFTHEIGQLTLGISYISILSWVVDKYPTFPLFTMLKNYGRQSMSSYIGHTVFGILIFYPIIAFGYFGQWSLENVFIAMTGVVIFQFIFCTIWFHFFSFGPIEWIWKCATYGKWYTIKKKKES